MTNQIITLIFLYVKNFDLETFDFCKLCNEIIFLTQNKKCLQCGSTHMILIITPHGGSGNSLSAKTSKKNSPLCAIYCLIGNYLKFYYIRF